MRPSRSKSCPFEMKSTRMGLLPPCAIRGPGNKTLGVAVTGAGGAFCASIGSVVSVQSAANASILSCFMGSPVPAGSEEHDRAYAFLFPDLLRVRLGPVERFLGTDPLERVAEERAIARHGP